MATKRQRYMISVDDEMFEAIEDFRFCNRYQTRSEATAELIRLGLEELKRRSTLEDDVEDNEQTKALKSVKSKVRAIMEGEEKDSAQK